MIMCVMSSRSQNVELVVFDFDGTILDTEWPHFTAVRDTFAFHGVELTLDEWQHRVGRADHPHWSELLVDALGASGASDSRTRVGFDLDAMIAECRARKDAATLAERVRPGVVDLFDRAEQAGVAIAVASSSPRDWVEPNLERLGLLGRVHTVRTRDDVPRAKPWPDVYAAACASVGVDAAAAVAIEDSHHGLAAAVAAGLPCIVAPNRVTSAQDFGHAALVVASLAAVAPGTLGLP
jgi:HAD superfamily hydrolase (TIGR01509 family)